MSENEYKLILLCVLSYLLGSIPIGFLIAKSKGIDIRTIGSGNIGATNVGRALGKKWQFIVLVLDAFKGVFAVLFAYFLFKNSENYKAFTPLLAGACAILGHNWTIFLKFKGGKGVSTTAGVIGALTLTGFFAGLVTYLIVTKTTKYVSLGSMLGSISIALTIFLKAPENESIYLKIFGILISALVIIRHKENIKRLWKGEETKIVKS
jgi:glycerol-3-phosphate acyltransferase PlsY